MGYKNFKLAVYCPVGNLNRIEDLEQFEKQFSFLEKHLHLDKVYLETFRDFETIDREKMLQLIDFFQKKGIKVSGGITTSAWSNDGFGSLCYTNERHRSKLKEIVTKTATIFDEIILDDFYFTNCKCASCIDEKGNRSWAEFRTGLMRQISEECVIQPAKQVNPSINLIIKYPNWYEHYQETGYNLKDEPEIFDMLYTGTETRDPQYTHQHLPRYLSYFIMRYLENIKPGKNAGGWFDPYQCAYNPSSYADQAYLTLFGKAKEVTLFSLGSLLDRDFSIFVPIAGHVLDTADTFLDQMGTPTGTATYIPYHSHGEDYLHDYMGMLGIPLEPFPRFPESKNVFLTRNASQDKAIVHKIKQKLMDGGNVVVTSGLLEELQDNGFEELATVRATGRKALIQQFGLSVSGVEIDNISSSVKPVLLPQLEYSTNDVWQLVCGEGYENNFPVLLKAAYGKGSLYILTIPDDFGELSDYPREVLSFIRNALNPDTNVKLDAPANIGLFTYDNKTFIVKSFMPHTQEVFITVPGTNSRLVDLATGADLKAFPCEKVTRFKLNLSPMSFRAYRIL